MNRKTLKWLEDIRDAAAFIVDITRNSNIGIYRTDRKLRQAVERNFEIVGEAMNRIVKLDPEVAQRFSEYPQIIAFRNVLIHGYDLIDDDQVWLVIQNQVPGLLAQAEELLGHDGVQ